MTRRVLASIEQAEGSRLTVRVYEQEGEEVERVAWRSGEAAKELLSCISPPDCMLSGRARGAVVKRREPVADAGIIHSKQRGS